MLLKGDEGGLGGHYPLGHLRRGGVRPHDRYGKGGTVEANGRYHATGCACSVHEQG